MFRIRWTKHVHYKLKYRVKNEWTIGIEYKFWLFEKVFLPHFLFSRHVRMNKSYEKRFIMVFRSLLLSAFYRFEQIHIHWNQRQVLLPIVGLVNSNKFKFLFSSWSIISYFSRPLDTVHLSLMQSRSDAEDAHIRSIDFTCWEK